jgi:hypothetical protein
MNCTSKHNTRFVSNGLALQPELGRDRRECYERPRHHRVEPLLLEAAGLHLGALVGARVDPDEPAAGLWIYEGALSFVNAMCYPRYRDSPYKQ